MSGEPVEIEVDRTLTLPPPTTSSSAYSHAVEEQGDEFVVGCAHGEDDDDDEDEDDEEAEEDDDIVLDQQSTHERDAEHGTLKQVPESQHQHQQQQFHHQQSQQQQQQSEQHAPPPTTTTAPQPYEATIVDPSHRVLADQTSSQESSSSPPSSASNYSNEQSKCNPAQTVPCSSREGNNEITDCEVDDPEQTDDDDGADEEECDEDDEDEEDEDDDDDEDEEEVESDDDSCEDIVDPGQHCHESIVGHQNHQHIFNAAGEYYDSNSIHHNSHHTSPHNISANCGETIAESDGDILDSDRIVEVTRKLVRSTERDPDRDLRKQVLLKTAIRKLPHFMEYNRYSETIHCDDGTTAQLCYDDSVSRLNPRFYITARPNAIEMSTTSLRMLDLNDLIGHDTENNAIEVEQQPINPSEQPRDEPTLAYNTRTSLDQNDYANQSQNNHQNLHSISDQYEPRYHHHLHHHHHNNQNHQRNDFNHYETTNPMIGRHNSLDNLYQNGSDITESSKDERIPIAFQIACEICDFTCAPDDNEKKLFDNLTNAYHSARPGKQLTCIHTDPSENISLTDLSVNEGVVDDADLMTLCGDPIESRDPDNGSDSSSSSNSSSSSTDDSVNSLASRSDEPNNTSLLEASLDSSTDYYHSSHDSGVALFSPRSNKRTSSSIELDDEMEIDHLTELSTRSQLIATNNQYKRLRKREIIE